MSASRLFRRFPTWSDAECRICGRRIMARNAQALAALNDAAERDTLVFCELHMAERMRSLDRRAKARAV